MVTRIFSNVASVIMDINTGALMFLNIAAENDIFTRYCAYHLPLRKYSNTAATFDILQYRQCTNKLRLCFQVKTDHAACTVKLQQLRELI
ncbi:hypothetical protein T12_12830 [Trichinella patagoniensis]|uniref:Uncharacterized protein n=1 Tax=Trichinella patagoniensis TaxID=990121 RepID=A0A0V1A4C4_9BILA|nr:hypothetical protein T12_12830 [Trichinella patagoniensis]